ncbi:hypothetical protein HDU93_000198 [Gonapodya sp. JEL0774]|nr:hypothetical protein HDU93_000198 [Gonapodya sp. JEL0774]
MISGASTSQQPMPHAASSAQGSGAGGSTGLAVMIAGAAAGIPGSAPGTISIAHVAHHGDRDRDRAERDRPVIIPPGSVVVSAEEHAEATRKHIELCRAVLGVWSVCGKQLAGEMGQETWLVLLKVMLGVADSLLAAPRARDSGNIAGIMADELGSTVLAVLFDLMLRSRLRHPPIWDTLRAYFRRWTHRVEAVVQWAETAAVVTEKVVGGLYGGVSPHDDAEEFGYYAWHRMTYVISDPNLQTPENFEVAIRGLSRLVDIYHSVSNPDDAPLDRATSKIPTCPDGNTLLGMFGAWLFKAARREEPEYEAGRADALAILCRIFCRPQRRAPFLRVHLELFYSAISAGLRGGPLVLTAVLVNAKDFFARDLEGGRLLVPDFVLAVRRVVPRTPPDFHSNVSNSELRRSCYQILGSLIAIPNHFDTLPVRDTVRRSSVAPHEENHITNPLAAFARAPSPIDLKSVLDWVTGEEVSPGDGISAQESDVGIGAQLPQLVSGARDLIVDKRDTELPVIKESNASSTVTKIIPQEVPAPSLGVGQKASSHASTQALGDSPTSKRAEKMVLPKLVTIGGETPPMLTIPAWNLRGEIRGILQGWDLADSPDSDTKRPLSQGDLTLLFLGLYKTREGANNIYGTELTLGMLKPIIIGILVTSLIIDSDSQNARILLHLLTCFVIEDVGFCPGLPGRVIQSIQEKILQGSWPPEVTLSAFETLNHYLSLWEYIKRDTKPVPRELVIDLCRYIEDLINEDSVPYQNLQTLIMHAYDCMIRWALTGQWIAKDRDCLQTVISTLSRGIALMDDMDFGAVNTQHPASGRPVGSLGPMLTQAGLSLSNSAGGAVGSREPNVGFVDRFSGVMQSITDTSGTRKKGRKAPKAAVSPAGTLGEKDKPHSRGGTQSLGPASGTLGVSSSTHDGGVGFPSFAAQSFALWVKLTAEVALTQLFNYLGSFPPFGEVTGVSRLGSTWNEVLEARRQMEFENGRLDARLAQNSVLASAPSALSTGRGDESKGRLRMRQQTPTAHGVSSATFPLDEMRKYLRYYAIENRIIVGVLERPWELHDNRETTNDMHSSLNDFSSSNGFTRGSSRDVLLGHSASQISTNEADKLDNSPMRAPSVAIVLRDAAGKHSWVSFLKYVPDRPDQLVSRNTLPRAPVPVQVTSPGARHEATSSLPTHLVPSAPLIQTRYPSTVLGSDTGIEGSLQIRQASRLGDPTPADLSGVHRLLSIPSGDVTPEIAPISPALKQFTPPNAPPNAPYLPGAQVMSIESFNESAIPPIADLFPPESESKMAYEAVSMLTNRQTRKEDEALATIRGDPVSLGNHHIVSIPPERKVRREGDEIPQAARLLLTHLGFLTLQNRHRVAPLALTDGLLRDLEKLDKLPDRDCFGVTILFARSGVDSVDSIIHSPSISYDFEQFLHSVAWPVDVKVHRGYRGNLDPTICDTAPYYANRNVEVVFHVPYYIRAPPSGGLKDTHKAPTTPSQPLGNIRPKRATGDQSPHIPPTQPGSLMAASTVVEMPTDLLTGDSTGDVNESTPDMIPNTSSHPPDSTTPASKSQIPSQSSTAKRIALRSTFLQVSQDDLVYIVWVEDMKHFLTIPKKVGRGQVYIFIHPLPKSPGLYFVRLHTVGGAISADDILVFGPLLDGMVVSRHAIGHLVRITAISAHMHCSSSAGRNYTRPFMQRRHEVEELCKRHRKSLGLSAFYCDVFG